MAEFQNLEIKLQAVDNASQVLQKVVDQLEQIKKLTSGSNTITPTGGNSSAKQIQGVKSLNSEYEKAKSNLDELIRKQNLLNEALKVLMQRERGKLFLHSIFLLTENLVKI